MPADEQYERLFRMKRALDLSLKHSLLPKDQWTKPEEVSLVIVNVSSDRLKISFCMQGRSGPGG